MTINKSRIKLNMHLMLRSFYFCIYIQILEISLSLKFLKLNRECKEKKEKKKKKTTITLSQAADLTFSPFSHSCCVAQPLESGPTSGPGLSVSHKRFMVT